MSAPSSVRSKVPLLVALALLGITVAPAPAQVQEGAMPPHWIWYPTGKPPGETPAETRYFRKTFQVKEGGSRLELDATADNSFLLYLDGKEIARGDDWHAVKSASVRLPAGWHTLAAVATNDAPGPAAFLVRGGVLPLGQAVPIHTDRSWKTTGKVPPGEAWTRPDFDDSSWVRAEDLGVLGSGPWTGLVFESSTAAERFRVPEGFDARTVAAPGLTGSVVAFTFDEEGRPCVSVEGGPILRLIDTDRDGQFDERAVIADLVKNCQGLAFIRGKLYAVGNGPKGTGLYRLGDGDGDGAYEEVELVRATDGGMGEHGPHAVMLGPDGCLYYNNGNHAHLKPPIRPNSPANVAYEGELLPHYNDPRGHAAGIMAPGGEIFRSDDDGKTWERISAGYRNQYDFAFNRDGEIFTFDSDMEWDIGLPWYRPVRVNHAIPGSEFGWRNGSGKWPPYYFDSLPTTYDVGRGSPTGVTFYQGGRFPEEYDDNFLICDWSQGRILAIALTPEGASYRAKAREFVAGKSGRPLNATDIEVGPDGAVYFSTGGRGTQGGLFRVAWSGARHAHPIRPAGEGPDRLRDALAMDSPLSSFGRRRLARIKEVMGDSWATTLLGAARDADRPARGRVRALDLLTEFGPAPEVGVLVALARDADASVRAGAVQILGMRDSDAAREALAGALKDQSPVVRRRACEALVRSHGPISVEAVLPLLGDGDRWVRFAARIAIEHAEPAAHREAILAAKDTRALLEGMLALVRATRLGQEAQDDLLRREAALLERSIDRDERLDLLRLIGLTSLLGPSKGQDAPSREALRPALLKLFPVGDVPTDRELARLLAYLDEPRAIAPILKAMKGDHDHADQIHYTYCLRAIKDGWTSRDKVQLLAWYESASRWEGGFSFLGYLDFMAQELIARLTRTERDALLAHGEEFPFTARVLVRTLDLDAQLWRVADLVSLYGRLNQGGSNPAQVADLRNLILDALGRSRQEAARQALRRLAQDDPARRDLIARALADHPTADDLPLLIAALDTRDPNTARLVLNALGQLDRAPEGPTGLRNLIRLARRTGPSMQSALNDLAARWTGRSAPSGDFAAALAAWEEVYRATFPDGPALTDDTEGGNHYTLEGLARDVLQSGLVKRASAERGRAVIARARCLDCHKFGDRGQGLGPDLTTVSSRFRPYEILESIVEPSKVISDQYRPTTVATAGGKVYNGMPTGADAEHLVLLLSDGTKVTIPRADVEEQKESKVSVMPEGLLDGLSVQEVADLLALFESAPRVEAPAGPAKP